MSKFNTISYPEQFQVNNILVHEKLERELQDFFDTSGQKDDFARLYRTNLKILSDLKNKCVTVRAKFEKLKNAKDIYSMKFKLKQNIRILFMFHQDGTILLLTAFYERESKDYSKAIDIAYERLKQYKGWIK